MSRRDMQQMYNDEYASMWDSYNKPKELSGPVGSRKEKLVLNTEGGNNMDVPKGFPGAHMTHGEVIKKMVLRYRYDHEGHFNSHYDYMTRHGWTFVSKGFIGTSGVEAEWEKYE